jgi:hypothetical protein
MAYGDIKRLNSNTAQLAATVGTLYTAPTGKRVQIGTIILHNTSPSNNRTAELFDNATSASAKFLNITLGANETFEFSPKVPLVLEGSETLQGDSDVASEVNVKIYGRIEE